MAHSNRAGPAGICRQFCAKASELIGLNIRTANAIIRNIIGPLEMQKAPRISNRNREARARGRQPLVILCFDTTGLRSRDAPRQLVAAELALGLAALAVGLSRILRFAS